MAACHACFQAVVGAKQTLVDEALRIHGETSRLLIPQSRNAVMKHAFWCAWACVCVKER